ncbi:MAG: ABC transporter ATP-binding protein [Pseudomonadota bacterium]
MSIAIEALSKTFGGRAAVDGLTFDIPSNALFAVVGPSGCGKSTLLRLIAGLETPDRGRIALDGAEVAGPGIFVPPEERRVGVVFQSYALWPHLTVAANVAFPYEAQGVARAETARKVAEHLNTVSLEAFAGRRPEALSGGQRQRVALARCLAGAARTILMDEPLANLDPHLRGAMESELRAFHERSGVTTLYITHDQREAMALADLMAVMEAGAIQQIGTPQEIYERPQTEMVARFVGRGSLIPAEVAGGHARIAGHSVPVSGGRAGGGEGQATVFVRPRDIVVDGEGWPVEIVSAHYRGGGWEAQAQSDGLAAHIMLDLDRPVRAGETLRIALKSGWVLPN